MPNRVKLTLCFALLLAGAANAHAQDTDVSGTGAHSPMAWVPETLRSSHSVEQDGDLDTDGEAEILLSPKTGNEAYALRFFTGPSTAAASQMIEFAHQSASKLSSSSAAELFDLDFPEGVPCFGTREDVQIICAFDGLALEFAGENVDYDTLRGLADQMPPLQALAGKS